MFEAKVYTVSIHPSAAALEEHISPKAIARRNVEEGERNRVAFRTIPNNYRGITPGVFIFAIENHVDEQKVEAAIRTDAKVLLFFRTQTKESMNIGVEALKKGTHN